MKKVLKVLPIIKLGGTSKLPGNSQIVAQRLSVEQVMIQNMNHRDFDISFNHETNKLTMTFDLKINDALVIYDDSGVEEKRVLNADN